jgi:hypothetical protein
MKPVPWRSVLPVVKAVTEVVAAAATVEVAAAVDIVAAVEAAATVEVAAVDTVIAMVVEAAAIVEVAVVDTATAMAVAIRTAVPARITAKQKPSFSRNGPGHPGPFAFPAGKKVRSLERTPSGYPPPCAGFPAIPERDLNRP